ncbi:MAG TPA: ferredoxin family protein [Negativicutes bacterium]|nr:ferredoxin family protein [Negativicutes bacterium]
MPIKVDATKCIGCGKCVEECPGDVLGMDPATKRPVNKYKNDCWYCGVCVVECPVGAAEMEFPTLVI